MSTNKPTVGILTGGGDVILIPEIPSREDALGGMPELACSRHDAAAVHEQRSAEPMGIFHGQHLAGELRGSIHADRRRGGECFRDTGRRESRGERPRGEASTCSRAASSAGIE